MIRRKRSSAVALAGKQQLVLRAARFIQPELAGSTLPSITPGVSGRTMRRAPLLVPAAAFLFAIIAEEHAGALAMMCLACALLPIWRAAAFAALCGVAIGHIHGHPATIEHEFRTSRYSGTIVGDVRSNDNLRSFPFAIDGIGTVRATSDLRVRPGEQLLVRGRIGPLPEARNPGEPSPRAIALDEGVIGELRVQRVLARRAPDLHDPRAWMPLLRERASQIVRATLPEPEATVLAGALWGERGTLPQDVRDDFQATGTVHVLVTAGLHLGVIAALIAGALSLLQIPRVGAALGAIPFVYGYAWLSGWHLPSQRAAAMIATALIARACGARAISLNTLAIAAIIVAASWPVAVESISFALSFSCVAAIVLFAEPIAAFLHAKNIAAPIAETLALTFSTQIGVWPLTAAVFFSVAPYAMLANAIIVPLVGVTMTIGIATLISHPWSALSAVFARWDVWLLTLILATTHAIALLPGARSTMPPPPPWAIAGYDAAVVLAALLVRKSLLRTAMVVGCASIGVAVAATLRPPQPFSITALDVGQGDALVIRTPHGRTILIDTGGRLERGATIDGQSPAERSADRIILPYLQRAGIAAVDLLLLTHPHGDHVGGAAAILRTMPVGWVADSGQLYGGRAYNDALAAARTQHVAVIVPACHQRWMDDEVMLTFLSPCGAQFTDGANDVNENSLVVLVQYGALRALFMGDAGFQSEERLLAQGVDLHADVLKVGHHGSAYSSSAAFIAAVHPRIAIVSVGRHNLFGHPAPVTLETLKRAGASIFRTDQCAAVTITTATAGKLTVNTMLSCSPAFR